MTLNAKMIITNVKENKYDLIQQEVTTVLEQGDEALFANLIEIYSNYSDDEDLVVGIAICLATKGVLDRRMFNGLALSILSSNNSPAILELAKGINNTKEKQRYLYELESMDMSNQPLFVVRYISSIITNIKSKMQQSETFMIREQTRMICGECNEFTDTKCVGCGRGICSAHIAFDAKEGCYCQSCHDIKLAAIRRKFKEDNEDKERVTSIKFSRPSNDKIPRD